MREWAERKYHAGKGNKKTTITVLKKQTCGFHLFELNLSDQKLETSTKHATLENWSIFSDK